MNSSRLPIVLCAFAAVLAASRAVPAAGAKPGPHLAIPPARTPVELDGTLGEGEWADAAVSGELYHIGGTRPAETPARFYFKYDDETLYVAAVCEEGRPDYPRAKQRDSRANLTIDDCVQVTLGLSDGSTGGTIDFGGYAGASGQTLAPVAHYYDYFVNAAGSRARTYNETPLTTPLFDAAVARGEGAWTVEMAIPLRSAGLDGNVAGLTLHGNFFRIRPPVRTGWVLPRWKGYGAMPFGAVTFLPEDRREQATQNPEPFAADEAEATEDPQSEIETAGTVTETIGEAVYYPAGRRLVASPGEKPEGATHFSLRVEGRKENVRDDCADRPAEQLILRLDEAFARTAPSRQVAILEWLDAEGDVLAGRRVAFDVPELPEWAGNDIARDYLDKKVPRPWAAPAVEGDEIRLAHTRILVGPNALPASIEGLRGELLAGPVEIELDYDGRENVPLTGESLEIAAGPVSATAEARLAFQGGTLEVRAVYEFDGFATVKVRALGCDPAKIEGLRLHAPLAPQHEWFLNRGHVQDTLLLSRAGYEGPAESNPGYEGPAGMCWLGGADRGLYFAFDRPSGYRPFRSQDVRRQILARAADTGNAELTVRFVDGPDQVEHDGQIFRFFLMPTPTRERPGYFVGDFNLWFEQWTDHQSYPQLSKLPEVAEKARKSHEAGRSFCVYYGSSIAETSPGFEVFGHEWITHPERLWYRRHYNPGKGVPCYVFCQRGPVQDLLVWGLDALVDRGDIDGIYMDGPTFPWSCHSPAHTGCGDDAEVAWAEGLASQIPGTREMLKRFRGVFEAYIDGFYYVYPHTGGGLELGTLSLCEWFREGEQLSRYRPGYKVPVHEFIVGYTGLPFGFRGVVQHCRPYDINGSMWSILPWTLVHDTEILGGGEARQFQNRILRPFDGVQGAFHPYWREQPHVRLLAGEVRMSYFRKDGEAMVIVSNLGYDPQAVELDVSNLFEEPIALVTDMNADEPVECENDRVECELPGWRFRAFRVETAEALARRTDEDPASAVESFAVEDFDSEQWKVSGRGAELLTGPDARQAGGLAARLRSTKFADYALARLAGPELAGEGTIRLKVRLDNRLVVMLGETPILKHDTHWLRVPGQPAGGTIRQVEIDPSLPELLEIRLGEDTMDVAYGREVVAEGLPIPPIEAAGELTLCTWHGDAVDFDVVEITDQPRPVLPIPEIEDFRVTESDPARWTLEGSRAKLLKGVEAARASAGSNLPLCVVSDGPYASVRFNEPFGRDLYVRMKFRQAHRLTIFLGESYLHHDGGRWKVGGADPRDVEGWLYHVPASTERTVTLEISLDDGELSVRYDGKPLVRKLNLAGLGAENDLRLRTWAKDWFAFEVEELSTEPRDLYADWIEHPIRE